MKKNFRKLQLFLAIAKIDISMFYNVEVNSHDIRMQAKFNQDIARIFREWPVKIDSYGHIVFKKSNITITLSE
jgi:hypothetical protein